MQWLAEIHKLRLDKFGAEPGRVSSVINGHKTTTLPTQNSQLITIFAG